MKDIRISAKQQRIELIWLAVSFILAFLMNIFAIIYYKTHWAEVYTQLLWVLTLTGILYALSVGIRIALYLVRRLFVRK